MTIPNLLLLAATSRLVSALLLPILTLLPIPAPMNPSMVVMNGISIEDWAKAALQSPYRQSHEQQLAIHTLESLFYGTTGAETAATTIASLFDPLLKHGFTVSPVFELWVSICEAIRTLGGNQDIDGRLIELLNAIAKLPDVKDQSGRAIGPGGGFSGVYWRDLPGFAITFREYAMGTLPTLNSSLIHRFLEGYAEGRQISSLKPPRCQTKATGLRLRERR